MRLSTYRTALVTVPRSVRYCTLRQNSTTLDVTTTFTSTELFNHLNFDWTVVLRTNITFHEATRRSPSPPTHTYTQYSHKPTNTTASPHFSCSLSGYYIIQQVGPNLVSRVSVIASRETNTAGWVISWSRLPYVICGRSRVRNV